MVGYWACSVRDVADENGSGIKPQRSEFGVLLDRSRSCHGMILLILPFSPGRRSCTSIGLSRSNPASTEKYSVICRIEQRLHG